MNSHMDLLTARLQKRGYNCNIAMQTRDEKGTPESGIKGLVGAEQTQSQPIAHYAFDVRA